MVRKRIAVVSLPAVMLDWVQARTALGNQQLEKKNQKKRIEYQSGTCGSFALASMKRDKKSLEFNSSSIGRWYRRSFIRSMANDTPGLVGADRKYDKGVFFFQNLSSHGI